MYIYIHIYIYIYIYIYITRLPLVVHPRIEATNSSTAVLTSEIDIEEKLRLFKYLTTLLKTLKTNMCNSIYKF